MPGVYQTLTKSVKYDRHSSFVISNPGGPGVTPSGGAMLVLVFEGWSSPADESSFGWLPGGPVAGWRPSWKRARSKPSTEGAARGSDGRIDNKIRRGADPLAVGDVLTELLSDAKFIAYVVNSKQHTLLAMATEVLGAMTGRRHGSSGNSRDRRPG
jgi:hypothetical protein